MPYICKTSIDGCANCNHPQATLDVATCPDYAQGWATAAITTQTPERTR